MRIDRSYWRRVYLDTGDLIRIADGKADEAELAELRLALDAAHARIVLSRAHLQDALSNVDAATRERFIVTVESFQPVLLVTDGPEESEPLPTEVDDIGVEPCSNFRELVDAPTAADWLEKANAFQDGFHSDSSLAQLVRTIKPRSERKVSKHAGELFLQSAITLLRGWKGDDVDLILAFWESQTTHLSSEERAIILRELMAFSMLTLTLRLEVASRGLDMTEVLRSLATVRSERSPGRALKVAVGSVQHRDPYRKRLRSDCVDIDHVSHFPYMDIVTCDANTLHSVQLALRTLNSRAFTVVANGNLSTVGRELRRLAEADFTMWKCAQRATSG